MSFQTWGESNPEAKKVLSPDFGIRTWDELAIDTRNIIWQFLVVDYFFEKVPVRVQYGGGDYTFYGNSWEQQVKEKRIVQAITWITHKYKAKNYAPNFLIEPDEFAACKDFYRIFGYESEHPIMELLSLYAKAIIKEQNLYLTKASGESEQAFQARQDAVNWEYYDDFCYHINELFSQFGLNYHLTRLGFVPRVDQKIIEEVYVPVLNSLSNARWKEVNNYLSESFSDYRKNTPEDYSTCVTKAVTALQAYLQLLVYGKTGTGDISKLIPEAQKKKLIPDDSFTKTILKDIESVLMQERQATGDPHPRKEFANEKNSRLVLNLVMVFLQHCIIN